MKKKSLGLVVLGLVLGSSISWTADQPSAAQPAAPSAAAPGMNDNVAAPNNTSVQTPPADWTTLTGMVQAVDTSAKTVQIKDESGTLLQVPVERGVQIEKDGKRIKLSQIQTGDSIKLSKKPASSDQGARTY